MSVNRDKKTGSGLFLGRTQSKKVVFN
jgi:hypothetical protein